MAMLKYLTDFLRLLPGCAFRLCLVDHKKNTPKSSGRKKPAFGGSGQPVEFVVKLARSAGSRGVSLLVEQADLNHQILQPNHGKL